MPLQCIDIYLRIIAHEQSQTVGGRVFFFFLFFKNYESVLFLDGVKVAVFKVSGTEELFPCVSGCDSFSPRRALVQSTHWRPAGPPVTQICD